MNLIMDSENKELFIKTINKKGFLLEDKTWKILNDKISYKYFERNMTLDYLNNRIDIDCLLIKGKHHFVIECKRTEYSWIFPKAIERSDTINLIFGSENGIAVKSMATSDFKTAWFDIAIVIKEDGCLKKTRGGLAQASYEDIHKKIKQVLKETEAYVSTRNLKDKIIMPVIVTNAKLYQLNYTKGSLDSNGDLIDYGSLQEIEGIAYNFAEIMKCNGRKEILSINDSSNAKSIFIINVNHLESFISLLCDQDI